ncbi:unnamed protein product [Chrysodeixis includens]|uniref:Gustatory receptor n=1 Tax=Chrysodeixis includens TaxID=689277 RepID=A0A9N8L3V4_CHRIL|nr:unnamed protein product [Chrysodeixis includens]
MIASRWTPYAYNNGVESAKVEGVAGAPLPQQSVPRAERATHCVVGGAHAFILRISSVVGLAPLRFEPQDAGFTVSISSAMCVYSYILVTVLAICTIMGVVEETRKESKSVNLQTPMLQAATASDLLIVVTIACVGVYGAPQRMRNMLKFMEDIATVDKSVPSQSATERKQCVIIFICLITFLALIIDDFEFYFRESQKVNREWKKPQTTSLLNIYAIQGKPTDSQGLAIDRGQKQAGVIIKRTASDELRLVVSPYDAVRRLAALYGMLCKVVTSIETSYGLSLIIILISTLLHLIVTPYFAIMEIIVSTERPHFLILQFFWCILHLLRLIGVVEPGHLIVAEIRKTKSIISRLMTSVPSSGELTARLKIFSRKLMLQDVTYSPMGMCMLQRPLIVSVGMESAKVEGVAGAALPQQSVPRAERATHCVVGGAHAFILRISSVVGLAPLRFESHGAGFTVSISRAMCVYSYILGTVLGICTITGLVGVMTAESNSVRMQSPISQAASAIDVLIVVAIACVGVYGAPKRMRNMLKFVEHFATVDKSVGSQAAATERKQCIIIFVCLTMFLALVLNDFGFYFREAQKVNRELKKPKAWSLLNIYAIRVAKVDSQGFANDREEKQVGVIIKRTVSGEPRLVVSPCDAVRRLAALHGTLCDVVTSIDASYGLPLIVILISTLLHLIGTPYFAVMEILVSTERPHYLILLVLWSTAHLLRLIGVMESGHLIVAEVKKTKSIISHLMTSAPSSGELSARLKIFSRQLMLQDVTYSPMGLCTLQRPLIASVDDNEMRSTAPSNVVVRSAMNGHGSKDCAKRRSY